VEGFNAHVGEDLCHCDENEEIKEKLPSYKKKKNLSLCAFTMSS
jgi:hypothetical protein